MMMMMRRKREEREQIESDASGVRRGMGKCFEMGINCMSDLKGTLQPINILLRAFGIWH